MTAASFIEAGLAGSAVFAVLLSVFLFFGFFNFLFAWNFRKSPPLNPKLNPGSVVIIVPVRDDPSIFKSLDSLRALDYPDYRILIVDDSADPRMRRELDEHREPLVEILHRASPIGRKAGAMNFAIDHLASAPPEYVVILDADHRPPADFLLRAVTLIEQNDAHCVSGYQKHDIGAYGWFGRFYRASGGAAIRSLKGQYDLGFGAYFAGAPTIFQYDWLRHMRFDETSITEDWELTLRAYAEGDFRVVVREDLWVSAAVPRNLGWLIRQQMRWIGGMTRDFRQHFGRLVRSDLTRAAKVGLFYHGLVGLQPAAFLLLWLVLPILYPVQLPPIPTLILLVFLGLSWGWPMSQGAKGEGYRLRQMAAVLLYGFLISYVLAPFGAFAFFSGLVRTPSHWKVTQRRG